MIAANLPVIAVLQRVFVEVKITAKGSAGKFRRQRNTAALTGIEDIVAGIVNPRQRQTVSTAEVIVLPLRLISHILAADMFHI